MLASLHLFYVFFRFPGKTLKGKKYKPLFPYFSKVCRLCVLVPVLCIVCHNLKEDLCLTLITCLSTNWHLDLCSLNLSINLSLTICGSIILTTSTPPIQFSSSSSHSSAGRKEHSRWWRITTSRRKRVQEWSTRHPTLELWVSSFLLFFFFFLFSVITTVTVSHNVCYYSYLSVIHISDPEMNTVSGKVKCPSQFSMWPKETRRYSSYYDLKEKMAHEKHRAAVWHDKLFVYSQ